MAPLRTLPCLSLGAPLAELATLRADSITFLARFNSEPRALPGALSLSTESWLEARGPTLRTLLRLSRAWSRGGSSWCSPFLLPFACDPTLGCAFEDLPWEPATEARASLLGEELGEPAIDPDLGIGSLEFLRALASALEEERGVVLTELAAADVG